MSATLDRNDDPMAPEDLVVVNIADVLLEEGLAITSSSLRNALAKASDIPEKVFTWRRAKPLAKESFPCRVEWLDEEGNFHVSPLEWSGERDRLQSLVERSFFRKVEISNPDRVWRKGEACLAKFLDNSWYRAEILFPDVDSDNVGVEFVDYGTKSTVLRRHVTDDISEGVKKFPILCFPVQLDVKPLTKTWATEVLDKIHLHVEGKVLDVNVKFGGNQFPFIVDMFIRDEDSIKENLGEFVIKSVFGRKGYRER